MPDQPITTADDLLSRLTDAALFAGYPKAVLYEEAADEIRRARAAMSRLTVRVNELRAELVEYENGRR